MYSNEQGDSERKKYIHRILPVQIYVWMIRDWMCSIIDHFVSDTVIYNQDQVVVGN